MSDIPESFETDQPSLDDDAQSVPDLDDLVDQPDEIFISHPQIVPESYDPTGEVGIPVDGIVQTPPFTPDTIQQPHDASPLEYCLGQNQDLRQALVHTEAGTSSAVIGTFEPFDADGSLSVIGVKHGLVDDQSAAQVGDYVDVWLADGSHVSAEVTHIHSEHDMFRAEIDGTVIRGEIDSYMSQALVENLGEEMVMNSTATIGTDVAFEQIAGIPYSVLRQGVVAGYADASGEVLALTGTEGGPGSSGSPVYDSNGNFVGQVLAYDPENHVNLVASAREIASDLDDFANGNNLEMEATPVNYGGSTIPVMSYAEEQDRAAASGRLGPAGGHCNEGHDSSGNPRGA